MYALMTTLFFIQIIPKKPITLYLNCPNFNTLPVISFLATYLLALLPQVWVHVFHVQLLLDFWS